MISTKQKSCYKNVTKIFFFIFISPTWNNFSHLDWKIAFPLWRWCEIEKKSKAWKKCILMWNKQEWERKKSMGKISASIKASCASSSWLKTWLHVILYWFMDILGYSLLGVFPINNKYRCIEYYDWKWCALKYAEENSLNF